MTKGRRKKKTGKFGENSQKNRLKFPISIWKFEKPKGGRRLNFSKMSEIQKSLKFPMGGRGGGGGKPIWEFSPNFPVFLSDASPPLTVFLLTPPFTIFFH